MAKEIKSQGASGPNLRMERDQNHSWHSAQRSQHYHEVVVGQTYRGANKMTQRRGRKDNMEEVDEKT